MSVSKELPKCFVCFQPTEKFGKTENTFLSVVMLLRMEGHLPYPPEGTPVLIKDWDPCEPCVPKTLDLYKEYAKLQETMEGQNGRGLGRRFKERRGGKANIGEGGIPSKESLEDGRNEGENGVKPAESNLKGSRMNLRKRRPANKRYADFYTAEDKESSPKKERRRTKGPKNNKCTGDPFKRPRPRCHLKVSQKCDVGRQLSAVPEKERPFKCPHCVKSFTTRSRLSDHVAMVHEGRVLHKCPRPNCKSTFASKQNINIHVATVHEKRRDFKCPICLKGFSTKGNCIKHVRVIHGKIDINKSPENNECTGTSFKCPRCPLIFPQKHEVGRHINAVHEKLKPFKCLQCQISFTTNYHRQRHISVVHEGIRPFKCPHCCKSFTEGCFLRDHVAIVHEGRVLYKCPRPNCKSTFAQKQGINAHVQSVHKKRKDFKCHTCLKGFFKKADLAKHVRVVHGTKAKIDMDWVD